MLSPAISAQYTAQALGLLLVVLAAVPAAAAPIIQPGSQLVQAGGAPGSVSSVLLHDLPPGLPVEVITFDDSEANLDIRRRFEDELAKAGQGVTAGAPLELSFSTEVVEGVFKKRQPSLGRIGASSEHDSGTRGSDSGVDVEVNVWSSTQDSVLGGRQPGPGDEDKETSHQVHYEMTVQLRDRASGEVLWQGEARSAMLGGDTARLARSMVAPLVKAYGRSVKDEPFEIK